MKSKVDAIIQTLKQAYINRDAAAVDGMLDALFGTEHAVLVGTSLGEWYSDRAHIKDLFLSDWADWGNVTIDSDHYESRQIGSLLWVKLNAAIEYVFEDTPECFACYYSTVKEIAASEQTAYQKSCRIQWILAHLLHSRDHARRKYLWDLQIHLIFENTAQRPICQAMQFALPVPTGFTDVRLDEAEEDRLNFAKECTSIRRCNDAMQTAHKDLKPLIIRSIEHQLRDADECVSAIELPPEHLIMRCCKDAFWFCGSGVVHRRLDLDTLLSELMTKIVDSTYQGDAKDALFRIRRDIAYTMKECSIGSNADVPFRVLGIGRADQGKLTLEALDLSYPFTMILEQKTDFAATVEP